MVVALAQSASHPAVAAWLGLGAAAVAAVVVVMAWSVDTRQIKLAELLARRQLVITSGSGLAKAGTAKVEGAKPEAGASQAGTPPEGARGMTGRGKRVPPDVIEGPDEVMAGEQARFRVQPAAPHQVVTWAVGGGAVSHAPDPSQPGDLLLIADQPGDLTIMARMREGLTERRATKSVTVVPEVPDPGPPFALRLFLHGWGLIVVAVLIVGFAGALNALGNFTSSDFIALAVPLAALLGVLAVARGGGEGNGRPAHGHGHGKRPG